MENNNIREKTYVLIIGLLPLLVLSSKFTIALVGGVVFLMVSILTSITLKFFENFIEKKSYEGYVILVSIFYVSLFRLILTSMGLHLVKEMGIYFSLISVNCYILYSYEKDNTDSIIFKMFEQIKMIFIYIIILMPFSIIRELLGTGKLDLVFRFGENRLGTVIDIGIVFRIFSFGNEVDYGLPIFILPTGAFFLLGIILSIYQYFKIRRNAINSIEQEERD